jgi:hypothetical protein
MGRRGELKKRKKERRGERGEVEKKRKGRSRE